jgi:CubicO group peptidase (beta-lactamase class C family)
MVVRDGYHPCSNADNETDCRSRSAIGRQPAGKQQASGVRSTQHTADAFAAKVLFEPLGIVDYHWEYTPLGQVDTGGHIHMKPRDMAKLGLLLLRGGTWDGAPVVPQGWIDESTAAAVVTNKDQEYGYLWWRRTIRFQGRRIDTFYAAGNGGQNIIVVPDLDLVATFTGSNYNGPGSAFGLAIFDHYVLKALRAGQ